MFPLDGPYRPFNVVPLIIVLGIGSVAYRLLYNLFLHPLAHIPGPKLAGATYLYQSYYNRRYYIHIKRLHEKYGPVVRVTPDEIHLSDAKNHEVIHHVGTKFSKDDRYYKALSIQYSTFSTASNDLHRIRRSALNILFSRKMVLELEEVIKTKAQKLCDLAAQKFSQGKPLDLHHGFRGVSVDVATDYCFNKSYDLLAEPDLGLHFFKMMQGIGPNFWVFQQFPLLQKIALMTPKSLAALMSAPLAHLFKLQEHSCRQILEVQNAMAAGELRADSRPTVFQHLLTPGISKGYTVPSVDNLKDEVISLLAAAADTTGNGMTTVAYYVLENPEIYKRLTAELRARFPDPNAKLDFITLEKLPYLTAVIREGLRLSFGVPGRTPRIVPEGGATFNSYFVPAGTSVSMSNFTTHLQQSYFPDPQKFDPERWLDPEEARKAEKSFVPFGKGTRNCVGMTLAYAELYITLGTFFRRFEHLRGNNLADSDLIYDDYFAAYRPFTVTYFHASNENDMK